MSIYVMTLGDLAKKRGEPVGAFVKKVNELGFEAGSHAKRLTQQDLDVIISLLNDKSEPVQVVNNEVRVKKKVDNLNVVMFRKNNKRIVALVDVTLNEDNTLSTTILSSSEEDTMGDALLEFRKQLGINLGVN